MMNLRTSDKKESSSAWGLQLLIGPAASTTSASATALVGGNSSSISFWSALLLGLWIGGVVSIPGGWHAVFEQLEQHTVHIYTGLVGLYLVTLLVAGPLESLYDYVYPPAKQVPNHVLEQKRKSAVRLPQPSAPTTTTTTEQPFDLSGAYKLMQNDGFENFLAVQGVPWALRRAANQARPVHRITHVGNQLTIKIEGIIESQTSYVIGGPPVETNVRGRIFEDQVRYLEQDGDGEGEAKQGEESNNPQQQQQQQHQIRGICVSKTALTEDYDVTVQRVLSQDGQSITMTSRAVFRDDREPVQCIQQFQRIE